MEIRRLPAKKSRIFDLVSGKYFPGSKEEMRSGYVISPFGEKISRVNVIGTVINSFVNDDQTYSTLTLDDGTETIQVRAFKQDVEKLANHVLGELVITLGKVREYNGEVYIGVETVRKIEDANMETMRKLELLDQLVDKKKIIKEIKGMIEKMTREELVRAVEESFGFDEDTLNIVLENLNIEKEVDYKPQILELISSLDDGEGVEVRKLFQMTNLPENILENTFDELLANGLLFEPKPGVVKRI